MIVNVAGSSRELHALVPSLYVEIAPCPFELERYMGSLKTPRGKAEHSCQSARRVDNSLKTAQD